MSRAAAIMRSVNVKKSIKYFLHNLLFKAMIKFRGISEHKTPQIELLVTICTREHMKAKECKNLALINLLKVCLTWLSEERETLELAVTKISVALNSPHMPWKMRLRNASIQIGLWDQARKDNVWYWLKVTSEIPKNSKANWRIFCKSNNDMIRNFPLN